MTTTTLTNASLADAVALFLSEDPAPSASNCAAACTRQAPLGHPRAMKPGRPVVVSLFLSRAPASVAETTPAFELLQRSTG
jgi:hypothetical protein